MNRPNVTIVGYGVVGRNVHKEFPWARIIDPYEGYPYPDGEKLGGFAFICVPTPKSEDGSCDTQIVIDAVSSIASMVDVVIVKSTVPPGTCDRISSKLNNAKIVFSPEYYGETQHANGVDYGFVTLGGHKVICDQVVQLYQYVRTGATRFYITNRKTAELAKYMENAFLATKVVFCNEFARIAKAYVIDYAELRELFIADPRVNPSHTFVYKDAPYYDSKCLNKDVPGIIYAAADNGYDAKFLRHVMDRNEEFKKS